MAATIYGYLKNSVLELKSSSLDLLPIILEIQYNDNMRFMRRAVDYCLQAFSSYSVESILLIICVRTVHQEIKDDVADSRFSSIYSYFCKPWAAECLIMCQDSLTQNSTIPLDPLIAIGLFLPIVVFQFATIHMLVIQPFNICMFLLIITIKATLRTLQVCHQKSSTLRSLSMID